MIVAPARRLLSTIRSRLDQASDELSPTWDITLGPVNLRGHQVTLDSPRLGDGPDWCTLRLEDQKWIEPVWVTSPLSWAERHTAAAWTAHWMAQRRTAQAHRSMELMVRVDGLLAGEAGFAWLDQETGVAELSGWIHSKWGTAGVGSVAGALLVDYGFEHLGLHRVFAPVSVDNVGAKMLVKHVGLVYEGLMASYLDVGGQPRDHELWAIVRGAAPPEGCVQKVLRHLESRALREGGAAARGEDTAR